MHNNFEYRVCPDFILWVKGLAFRLPVVHKQPPEGGGGGREERERERSVVLICTCLKQSVLSDILKGCYCYVKVNNC